MSTKGLKLLSNVPEHEEYVSLSMKKPAAFKTDTMVKAYFDNGYRISLEGFDTDRIKSVSVFINEEYLESVYSKGDLRFLKNMTADGYAKIFEDYIGNVMVTLIVKYADGAEELYYSDYLSLLVACDGNSDRIVKMIDYIFDHQRDFMLQESNTGIDRAEKKNENVNNIYSKIKLSHLILHGFDQYFSYFKLNSKFEIRQDYQIDHIEKLQFFTPRTLQFIATHPEYMKECRDRNGVPYGGKRFFPEKTLIPVNRTSRDVYENRAIISFVKRVILDLKTTADSVTDMITDASDDMSDRNQGYFFSVSYLYSKLNIILQEKKEELETLIKEYERVYRIYSSILGISAVQEMMTPPKPTAVFLSIPQYNYLYNCMYQWFDYGDFNLEYEKLLLSFIQTHRIYEYYVLCRLLEGIKEKGFEQTGSERKHYPVDKKSRFQNSEINNVFSFSDQEQNRITLFYQSVIYNYDSSEICDVGLYRNNGYSHSGEFSDGKIYTPDYILKVQRKEQTAYYILDAKYSDRSSVQRHHIASLSFKYLFSVSPISDRDVLGGIGILYGKENDSVEYESVYNYMLPQSDIRPKAVIASVNDENEAGIARLLSDFGV